MVFTLPSTGEVVATCIVVPLNRAGWDNLVAGRLAECDLDDTTLFQAGRDQEIGLHLYHLEKTPAYPAELPRFGRVALEALSDALKTLPQPVRVCGLSGLTVTKAGVSLFANLYGCREREYVCKEHILRSAEGQLEVHEANSQEELAELLEARGLQYVVRARMLVVAPEDPSLVWLALGRGVQAGA